jgi:hypothetical protein
MRTKNFEMLKRKIINALAGWKVRNLSLLGKILIYKTFGLSQIIYVLTVLDLDAAQYKDLDNLFYSFIFGREITCDRRNIRISKSKLCTPVLLGGFGMINFKEIINGIRCKQFGKLLNVNYTHPLKYLTICENKRLSSAKILRKGADQVANHAHELILNRIRTNFKQAKNDELLEDVILRQQLGETETVDMIKVRWLDSPEATELVHHWNCMTLREIITEVRVNRRIMVICKRVIKSVYLRAIKSLVANAMECEMSNGDKIKLTNGTYKHLHSVTSKEFRILLKGKESLHKSVWAEGVEDYVIRDYLHQVNKLKNTRQKNTLLRVWNGDCLSYSRLVHYGVVNTNECPDCHAYDSPEHMLIECNKARQTWELLMAKIPKRDGISMKHYIIGLNDDYCHLMVKAEVLKHLMHFRELEPVQTLAKIYAQLRVIFGDRI